eukprot:g4791.t1
MLPNQATSNIELAHVAGPDQNLYGYLYGVQDQQNVEAMYIQDEVAPTGGTGGARHKIRHEDVDGDIETELVTRQACYGLVFTLLTVLVVGYLTRELFAQDKEARQAHFLSKYLAEDLGVIGGNGFIRSSIEWIEDEIEHDIDEWRDILGTSKNYRRQNGAHEDEHDLFDDPTSAEDLTHGDGQMKGEQTQRPRHLSQSARTRDLEKLAVLNSRDFRQINGLPEDEVDAAPASTAPPPPSNEEHAWSDAMPSDLDFRRRMKSSVLIKLDSEKSNVKMVLPPRDLNVHGYRGISIGKYKKPGVSSTSSSHRSNGENNNNLLYLTLELANHGNDAWEVADHVALRELDQTFFRHEILHEDKKFAHVDDLDHFSTSDSLSELYDDSRGMQNRKSHDIYLQDKVSHYEKHSMTEASDVVVAEKITEDPDVMHDDDYFFDSSPGQHRRHGVFGKDLSFTHGELDAIDSERYHDHLLHLTRDVVAGHNSGAASSPGGPGEGKGGSYSTPGSGGNISGVNFIEIVGGGQKGGKRDNSLLTSRIRIAEKNEADEEEAGVDQHAAAVGRTKGEIMAGKGGNQHHAHAGAAGSNIEEPLPDRMEVRHKLHPGESISWDLKIDFSSPMANYQVGHHRYAFSVVDWLVDEKTQWCDPEDVEKRFCTGRKRPVLRNFGPVIVLEVEE